MSAAQLLVIASLTSVDAKLADRSRVVKARHDSGKYDRFHDNGRPIEGQSYRSVKLQENSMRIMDKQEQQQQQQKQQQPSFQQKTKRTNAGITVQKAPWERDRSDIHTKEEHLRRKMKGDVPLFAKEDSFGFESNGPEDNHEEDDFGRKLSSQLTGCCYDYQSYGAADLCAIYGNDCESGETPSHDSGDGDCSQDGLSFIGVSFSVNTASSNPYSYQLCDQFPMENIIDRNYDYVMSMDEDGWLVGGGYKTFDYSGKMP